MKSRSGFTIVELLIVIVVIAILAAISIVSYNGIQNRANDTAVQSDLRNLANKILQYDATNGTYPAVNYTDSAATVTRSLELSPSKGAYSTNAPSSPSDSVTRNVFICVIRDGPLKRFGLAAISKSGKIFYYTHGKGLTEYTTDAWSGYQSVTCPRVLGIPDYGLITGTGFYSMDFGYDSQVGWRPGW